MKKLILFLTTALMTATAWAANYSGTLTISVETDEGTQISEAPGDITLTDNGDGSYTLSINNFMLDGIPVGNIVVTAPGTTANGLTSIVASETIQIAAGDPSVSEEWIGPFLGDVPINMVLAFNDYAMTTNIDIYMAELEQNINVKFAMDGELTGYQIKNSGFEDFKDNGEPFAWHGFKSASGGLASSAKGTLGPSTDVRSGATGQSAVITSGSTFGIINNGTMTTGQLNAGNMSATNTANHSHMTVNKKADGSETDGTDANGDPFYTVMHGRPDAITFWLKFTQGTNQSTYKYATMSAIITDGTYYQDPEDKTYTNKLATAKNNTIERCDWSEFTVPFTYIDESLTGKGLLVTFSTNATPGKGSKGDQVFVDDIALVYNAAISGISLKGEALENFAPDVFEYNFTLAQGETFADSDIDATLDNCPHAYLVKKVLETEDGGYKIFVAVVSNDLNTTKVYTINYAPAPVVTYTVTFNYNGEQGQVDLLNEGEEFLEGDEIRFIVTPKPEYLIDGVEVLDANNEPINFNGEGENVYSFMMPASNVNVNVTFLIIPIYTINTTTDGNGSIIELSTNNAREGETITFMVEPAEHYAVENVEVYCETLNERPELTVDGSFYSFNMPADNVTISASFVKDYTEVTLEEALMLAGDEDEIKITSALAIVDVVESQGLAYATDGEGNWIELKLADGNIDDLNAISTAAAGTIVGTFSHDGLNPVIVLDELPAQADVDISYELRTIPVSHEFAPQLCEVFNVTGYYHAAGGTNDGPNLREWSGNSGEQGVLLDLDLGWTAGASMIEGEHYKIRAIAQLKEAWDPSNAGRRPMASADDDMALRNYTIQAVSVPDAPTAIQNLNGNSMAVKSVRYYNMQGIEMKSLTDGINIVVIEHVDGTRTTTKVLR